MSVLVCVFVVVCWRSADAGTASRNSIKSPGEPVSVSPQTDSRDPGTGTRSAPTTCALLSECGLAEFCSRGICQPCRKRRKRCARNAMCCTGNYCINGVCQAGEVNATQAYSNTDGSKQTGETSGLTETHNQNGTMKLQQGKKTATSSKPQEIMKGGEGEACLRSSDCSMGLCCARHFWSRICKPVLTEGQVCTRHHRKDTHNLEIFQRCDCGHGLVCRAQRVTRPENQQTPSVQEQQPEQQEQQGKNNKKRASRNLHTCQPR